MPAWTVGTRTGEGNATPPLPWGARCSSAAIRAVARKRPTSTGRNEKGSGGLGLRNLNNVSRRMHSHEGEQCKHSNNAHNVTYLLMIAAAISEAHRYNYTLFFNNGKHYFHYIIEIERFVFRYPAAKRRFIVMKFMPSKSLIRRYIAA